MDIEKILNNVVFNYGWRVDSDFILFGKNNSIKIIFGSYDENELINHIQKNCLNQLNEKKSEYSNIVISLLKTYIEENKISIETKNIENEINLTSILITQEGDVLFLFEVNWDIENSWKKSLSEGKKIEVDIQIIYDSDKSTKRPLGFFVEYKIDGIEQSPIYHYN